MTPSLFSFGRARRRGGAQTGQTNGASAPAPPPVPEEETAPPVEQSPAPAPAVSEERLARIDEALANWRDELIDLGGVSSLDDIDLLGGGVDLTSAHPSGLAQLYAGRPTHLGNLVREHEALGKARQNLRDVVGQADTLARQFGVAPVYLAIGVATWTETVPVDEPAPNLSGHFTSLSREEVPGQSVRNDAFAAEMAALDDEPAPGAAPSGVSGASAASAVSGASAMSAGSAASATSATSAISATSAASANSATTSAPLAFSAASPEAAAPTVLAAPAVPSMPSVPISTNMAGTPGGDIPGTGAPDIEPIHVPEPAPAPASAPSPAPAPAPAPTAVDGPSTRSPHQVARAEEYAPGTTGGPRTVVRTVNAPVLLRPVRLSNTTSEASLTLDPSIELNPVLSRALRRYGSDIDVDAMARAALTSQGFTPRATLARLGNIGREYLPGFDIHERLVVGAFVHPGQALIEDFDATLERARTSALVSALAGDEIARKALDVAPPPPCPTDRSPEAERGAGDLDPAQLDAIEAVGSGASLLLDAPPGSDVAATLAAVVADAAALGRTVLHVPATSADGHAVADALRDLGLGAIVLDLTEDAAWRRHAAEGVKEALGSMPTELDVPALLDMRARLVAVRSRLSGYVAALHQRREPWGVSAYDALQKLADLTSGRVRARTKARISPGRLERLDEEGGARAVRLLARAHSLGVFTPRMQSSAWNGITVVDIDEATDALANLRVLADEILPSVMRHTAAVEEKTGMVRAATMEDWCDQLDVLDGVRDSLDIFSPEVFERSAADLVIATASKRWRDERSIEMSGSTRRRFTRQAKDLVRPGREVSDLHGELVKVQQRREAWRQHDPDGGWPTLPPGLDAMTSMADRARRTLEELQPVLGRAENAPELMTLPLEELGVRVRALADDEETAQILPEIGTVRGELEELGLTPLARDLAERNIGPGQLQDELTYCWWSSLLAQILRDDPAMGGLDAHALNDMAETLRDLDAAQVASLSGPVANACARRVRQAVEANKQDARELYRALSREDGVPLRDIIAAHPVAMVAKPVWIVPPTLVPQIFTSESVLDLAVLDASAHMPVAQVMPAFVRAEQVLVVGDPRRATSGLAAELGPLLPRVTLPTGRNTLDPQIAAFLAANGYEGVVEAVPAPPGAAPLTLDKVDGRGMPAPGQSAIESVPAEVDRVVDLVIEHALTRPEESLAVIALNARHAEEIRRAATAAASGAVALEEFFAAGIAEPFVVTDLTEARSLRRDHAIISVGYAKTPHGRTIHNFGPVSEAGGMVGLVEALCVSRGRTRVVSSLVAEDLDPERLHAPGARLLREVLARAAGENDGLKDEDISVPDRLLVDLAEHLWRKGLEVVPHYGVEGGPRIPLAIGHTDYPGELFVAVLTDDEAYVAEPSLRRRDRHWVERLRQRGWHVHTAFSAGVFVDPEAEARRVERLVLSVLEARELAGSSPYAQPVPERLDDYAPMTPAMAVPALAGRAGGSGTRAAGPKGAGVSGGSGGAAAGRRGRAERPPIAEGLPLQAYSDDQLDDMVTWIRSDGIRRDEDSEVEELRAALMLTRQGTGIDAVLTNAVRRGR